MPNGKFAKTTDSLIYSARNCSSITPSDVDEITQITKAMYVGTGGDVTLRSVDGETDVRFANVNAGAILHVRALFARSTGTTTSDIVGLA